MAIITLTSDWGTSGYYAAAVKGTLLSYLPDANIVDITHSIKPFDTAQAGFALSNSFRCFPKGTIHIIALESIESKERPHVVVKAEGHYFISADNGIFGHILNPEIGFEEAVYIDVLQDTDFFTFAARDRFAKIAALIAQGEPLSNIGAKREKLDLSTTAKPVPKADGIEGIVMYIDGYSNLITNISKPLFEEVRKGRDFTIKLKSGLYTIDKISESYLDVFDVELVALFGTHGFLEIAFNHAPIAPLLGIEQGDPITISFGKLQTAGNTLF